MSILRDLIPPPGVIRLLAVSNLVRTCGNGFLISVSVLYFIHSVDLPARQVGLGLTVAAVLGMLVSIPAGHAADVLGPRTMAITFVALQGVAVAGYALVQGFVGFLVAVSLVTMAESAGNSSRGALVAGAVPSEERVRARAYLRSVTNVGISIGTVLGGVALGYNSHSVYVPLLVLSGLLYVAGGLIYLALAPVPPAPRPEKEARRTVLSDRPFVLISVLNIALVMNGGLLTVALPIWIAERTDAPVSLYAGLLLLNTVIVILFQVRASKGAETVQGGARALSRSGVLTALSCGVFALAAGRSAWLAAVCLIAGTLVHVVGELLYSAGSWAVSYELAPAHAQGQYQGMFGLTTQLGTAITPAVTTALVISFGWPGWLLFGLMLLAAALAMPRAVRWAERTREPAAEPATA
ncbi:MFS transporter [Streptomyces sp. NPDC048331]|uniref:MFS transporter n=1 Tax=unclassified Streptomyces TaxID=2593676 RepID=UPI003429E20C